MLAGESPSEGWTRPQDSKEVIDVDAKFAGEAPHLRFATHIHGVSCYPILQPKDIAIWQSDHNPAPGTIVLAANDSGNCSGTSSAMTQQVFARFLRHSAPLNQSKKTPRL